MSNYIITTIDPDYVSVSHSVGTSSTQTSAITTGSGLIRIAVRSGHCHVKFGANPTATDDSLMMPENHVEIFAFKSGDKVAFIRVGGGSSEINICAVD